MRDTSTGNILYGKYRGVVTRVDAATMRIKARLAVLDGVESGWAMPCVPYAGESVGFAFLPEVDSGVWIEFEQGDVSHPIWTGGFWLERQAPPRVTAAVKVIATSHARGPSVTSTYFVRCILTMMVVATHSATVASN